MKRLIISAHHSPSARLGRFYGEPPGSKQHAAEATLEGLASVFAALPRAAAQVEDLFLAACNTGHHETSLQPAWKLLHRFGPIFPNLQTAWAYEATAPSGGLAMEELADWEHATRQASAKDRLIALSRYRRYEKPAHDKNGKRIPEGPRSIVWTREGDDLVPRPAHPAHTAA